ncbi:hypothetical protein ACSLBF_10215 [Pseudoalteromonas sp. T1lg65]
MDAVLRRLKQSGELAELIRKAENRVITQHCQQSTKATELCRQYMLQKED